MDPTSVHGSHLPGGSHRQADIKSELAADDVDLTPERDELDTPSQTLAGELAGRSELATYLLPSIFPAPTAMVLDTARENGAPSELLARLERLPPATYHTVQEVWTALGEPTESRAPEPVALPTAEPTPTASASGPALPAPSISSVPGWIDGAAKCAGRLTELMVRAVLGGTVAAVTVARRHLRH